MPNTAAPHVWSGTKSGSSIIDIHKWCCWETRLTRCYHVTTMMAQPEYIVGVGQWDLKKWARRLFVLYADMDHLILNSLMSPETIVWNDNAEIFNLVRNNTRIHIIDCSEKIVHGLVELCLTSCVAVFAVVPSSICISYHDICIPFNFAHLFSTSKYHIEKFRRSLVSSTFAKSSASTGPLRVVKPT